MKKHILILIIFVFGLNTIWAQDNDTKTSSEYKVSRLNGHQFLTASHFKSSFINTTLQANLGIGATSVLDIPGIKIGDYRILQFKGRIMFFNAHLEYQQRFTPWLAMYLTYDMTGRVGADMSTILADGVNTMSGGEIGALIRLMQSKKLNLSTNINVQNLTGNFINVVEYVEEIIDGNPYPSVVKKVPAMSVEAGLLGAYAINATYGFQFHAEFGYGESYERGNSAGYLSAGFSAEADLNPSIEVPIGFGLGYSLSSAPEVVMNNDGYSNLIHAKIGYTGAKEFELGLEYTLYNIHINSIDGDGYINNILLMLKFYF